LCQEKSGNPGHDHCRKNIDYLFIESGEVELVLDVVLVDLAEKFVASEATEPRNPADLF
jgi:hypothetical protein